jgi:hypothetical protein
MKAGNITSPKSRRRSTKDIAGTIRMRSIVLAPFNVQDGSHYFVIQHDNIFKVDEAEAKRLEKEHKAMRLY